MSRRYGRAVKAAALLSGLVLLLATSASTVAATSFGAPLQHRHFDFIVPDDNVCGIPVVSHFTGEFTVWETVNSDGLLQFRQTDQTNHTITNPVNGHWVFWFDAAQTTDLSAVPSGGNLITVTTAVTGIPERVTSSSGALLTTDVGRIVFVGIIDDGGTPLDTSDDVLVSSSIGFDAGPHPDAETGIFCSVVLPVLM